MAKTGSRPTRGVYVAIGIASSVFFLGFALSRLEFSDVADAFRRAEWFPWLPAAVATYCAGQWVRGVRCRQLVSREAHLTTLTATNVVVLGYAVNNLLPARLGEFARAGMLSQRTGLPFIQSLSLTFVERILDGLVMLALLGVSLAVLPSADWISTMFTLAVPLFSAALLGLIALVLAPSYLLRWSSRLGQLGGARVHDKLVVIVEQATRGAAYLRDPRAATEIVALSVVVWLVEGCMFLLLMPAFGIRASPAVALLCMTITNLGILLPSSPGFIGPFHYFCMRAMTAVGVSEAVGFSYASLVHLTFYIPITLWGVGILFSYGFGLSEAVSLGRAAVPLSPGQRDDALDYFDPPADPEPGRMTTAICEALIEFPAAMAEPDQRKVLEDVAAFVAGAIRALPLRLLVLLRVGMFGVDLLTRLRFLRGFSALPVARRRRWTEAWAYGSFSLGRQLFRLMRMTTLMAYFEHPLVKAILIDGAEEPGRPLRHLELAQQTVNGGGQAE